MRWITKHKTKLSGDVQIKFTWLGLYLSFANLNLLIMARIPLEYLLFPV